MLKPLESRPIRTVWNESVQKRYFVIADIVKVFTNTPKPREYIKKRRKFDEQFSQQWGQIVTPLSLETNGGKQTFNCADAQGLLMIIQSITSQKAVPFQIWLAKVESVRFNEIENSELLTQRTKKLYMKKGYHPCQWIEKKMQSIKIPKRLTKVLKSRAAKEQKEYAFLKAEIANATLGITLSEYKKIKGLQCQKLRDLNTDLDLIFRLLGDASAKEIVANIDTKEFIQNKKAW
ncbi:MAG: phage antirepressor protein [Bacteroidetes bacterium]|nr:MAG: phage antirepressor protein [Bacteroidota bacterium]